MPIDSNSPSSFSAAVPPSARFDDDLEKAGTGASKLVPVDADLDDLDKAGSGAADALSKGDVFGDLPGGGIGGAIDAGLSAAKGTLLGSLGDFDDDLAQAGTGAKGTVLGLSIDPDGDDDLAQAGTGAKGTILGSGLDDLDGAGSGDSTFSEAKGSLAGVLGGDDTADLVGAKSTLSASDLFDDDVSDAVGGKAAIAGSDLLDATSDIASGKAALSGADLFDAAGDVAGTKSALVGDLGLDVAAGKASLSAADLLDAANGDDAGC